MDREPALRLPPFGGALVTTKEGGDFLPRFQAGYAGLLHGFAPKRPVLPRESHYLLP